MLVSLPILIALRHIIYHCKHIDEHFPTQVQLCESVQPFMRYLQTKLLQLLMVWYLSHLMLLLYISHMCGWPSFGAFQCNLVCENRSTCCGDTSWIKFVIQILKLSLTLYTFSITSSVAGLFLTNISYDFLLSLV